MHLFLFAIMRRLGEECYHICRVILINENLFVTHGGYGRLIAKEQNKGGSQVRADEEEEKSASGRDVLLAGTGHVGIVEAMGRRRRRRQKNNKKPCKKFKRKVAAGRDWLKK